MIGKGKHTKWITKSQQDLTAKLEKFNLLREHLCKKIEIKELQKDEPSVKLYLTQLSRIDKSRINIFKQLEDRGHGRGISHTV